MQGLARSALMLAATRAQHKAGRADAREGAAFTYRRKPTLPPKGRLSHALEILLQFLPLLGLKAELTPEPLEFFHSESATLPQAVLKRRAAGHVS